MVEEGGASPMDALKMATCNAADLMRKNTIGALEAGFDADIIAVESDPLKDINAMLNVTWVMQNGNVVKQ